MASKHLILSLFPGIGLLDLAFEMEFPDACIVRGPDLIYNSLSDIRRFSPPAGVFAGVIGGPPCQMFSRLASMVRHNGYEPRFGNLIPEFERVVEEAGPAWFLMENVRDAPAPNVSGYIVRDHLVNNRWFVDAGGQGAQQNRMRRFSFGTRDGTRLAFDVALFEAPTAAPEVTSSCRPTPVKIGGSGKVKGTFTVTARHAGRVPWAKKPTVPGSVTAGHGGAASKQYVYSLEDACELQGLPRDFCDEMPFTKAGKLKAVANGVPIPMGRAVARAVRRALGVPLLSQECADAGS